MELEILSQSVKLADATTDKEIPASKHWKLRLQMAFTTRKSALRSSMQQIYEELARQEGTTIIRGQPPCCFPVTVLIRIHNPNSKQFGHSKHTIWKKTPSLLLADILPTPMVILSMQELSWPWKIRQHNKLVDILDIDMATGHCINNVISLKW